MKTKKNTRINSFEDAARPQLRLVEKAQALVIPAPANDALRLDQYRRQKEMLQEALKNAAVSPTDAMLVKQEQPARFTAEIEKTIAYQAAQQENSGNIFSSAYSRFYFI
jgi:hypothetical protein